MSKQVKPDQVMAYLNELFTAFDELVDTYKIYKACARLCVHAHVCGRVCVCVRVRELVLLILTSWWAYIRSSRCARLGWV